MTETPGLDWSTARPDPASLPALGFRFAMRYASPLQAKGPNPKDLSATELRALQAAGLAVGLVFESTAGRALTGGTAGGLADGQVARARAAAIGYPSSCVLFYAIDFGAGAAQLPAVTAYGQAFAAGVGGPSGPYGSADVVDHLADVGASAGSYYWQTAAWSGGRLSAHAHLLQRAVKHWPNVAGTDENVLCAPLPLLGSAGPVVPSPTAPTGEDDMAASIIRNNDTGEMALLAPGLFWHIPSPAYIALYVAAGLAKGPAIAFGCNTDQYNHLRDVALSGQPTAAAGLPAELLDQLQVIAGVDSRIIAAVTAAHAS